MTEMQTRDLALAVMIHLSGQDPKDYGYKFLQPSDETLYLGGTVGFENSDQRDAALKKWAEWTAQQAK